MASVIGITALAIGFASDTKQARRDYEPRAAVGTALVALPAVGTEASITDAIHAVLPGRPVYEGLSLGEDTSVDPAPNARLRSVSIAPPGCTVAASSGRATDADARCVQGWEAAETDGDAGAYSIAALKAFGVPMTAQASSVLAAGGVLVASPSALRGHQVLVGVVSTNPDGSKARVVRQVLVPGALLPTAGPKVMRPAAAVMTPETAKRLGVPTQVSTLAIGGPELTAAQEDKVSSALLAREADLYVERGFHQPYALVLVLLALIGGLVVLVATVTATGLAMSEARPDLATLAAVGAPPRTRRLVASAQAMVIGLLGTLLGVGLGFVPGLAVTWPLTVVDYGTPQPGVTHPNGPVIAIPWTLLVVVVIAVPVVSGLVTGLFTRSRLPMVRRLAT
jgi:putative ABC transport system permease protein